MIAFSLEGVILSLVLVAIAVAVSIWWKIPVQKDMAFGSVRAFIQLVAVGYALRYIFALESGWLVLFAVAVMLLVGASVAAKNSRAGRGTFLLCLVAMTGGSLITIGLMLAAQIIEFSPRYVIPLAGMIVSNAMNAAALTLNRLHGDVSSNRLAIETALSLGKSWREASRPYQKQAAIAGMLSMLNFMKTVGIVALPGAMTGMILAGAEPLEAVFLQIIVAYMLLSAVAVTSVIVLELTVHRLFTPQHQLRQAVE